MSETPGSTPEKPAPQPENKTVTPPPIPARERRRDTLRVLTMTGSILVILAVAAAAGVGYYYSKLFGEDLPDIKAIKQFNPSFATRVYDDKGDIVADFYTEKRMYTPLGKIPRLLMQATIAVEDAKFYEHHGINFEGIARAMFENLKAGKVVQGGSSITQQVAKVLLLSPERTFDRKIKEALLSIEIERNYSKDEILEIYLNQVYYGHGAYGVAAAAETYFGKELSALTLGEIAMIASLPKAPSSYSPYNNMEKARARRGHVLNRLLAINAITPDQAERAGMEVIKLSGHKKPANRAPWFAEHLRRYLEKQYGATRLYRGGLKVNTTLDVKLQQHADAAVTAGLEELDKRLGYRGPLANIKLDAGHKPDWATLNPKDDPRQTEAAFYKPGRKLKGVVLYVDKTQARIGFEDAKGLITVENLGWAHKPKPGSDLMWAPLVEDPRKVLKRGDVVEVKILDKPGKDGVYPLMLDQTPEVQAALLAIDPRTGGIKAMVGGYDAETSKFNRAVQAMRQPGSAFKPVIYTAALDNGFTPATIVMDSPVSFDMALTGMKEWTPTNFEEKYFGPTRIREAVTFSRNVVTVKVLSKIGVRTAVDYARRFGITSPLDPTFSLGLGASTVTVEEMTGAFATLANGGARMNQYYVKSVADNDGAILENNEPSGEQVISPEVAYLMTSVMESVVQEGTAETVSGLGRHIAGKTGTTNNFVDAWFIGFTPDLVCAVWVGRDDNKPIGHKETGARAAIPIWMRFMKEALKNRIATEFVPPDDIIFVRVDKKTGLLTDSTGEDSLMEAFIKGTQPTEYTGAMEGDWMEKFNESLTSAPAGQSTAPAAQSAPPAPAGSPKP
ncbi:MAG: PBP1A family penicillin-binding protein [Nitrospinae bacterium]|nr:PBP1A family penicillin-binding protein [Nitrospinota bacterium]